MNFETFLVVCLILNMMATIATAIECESAQNRSLELFRERITLFNKLEESLRNEVRAWEYAQGLRNDVVLAGVAATDFVTLCAELQSSKRAPEEYGKLFNAKLLVLTTTLTTALKLPFPKGE